MPTNRVRICCVLAAVLLTAGDAQSLDLAGMTVTPHVGAPGTRYRRGPIAPLGERVQVFLRNAGDEAAAIGDVLFDGRAASAYLEDESWSWCDCPVVWAESQRRIPAGALVVMSFNRVAERPAARMRIEVSSDSAQKRSFDIEIQKPRVWLSSVTFLGPADELNPNEMLFYVRNESPQTVRVVDCRLFVPRDRGAWRWLFAQPWCGENVGNFSADGRIEPGGLGGARVATGKLPLTYGAVEVRLRDDEGNERSLWAHLRIKKECFDISGGWVSGSTPKGRTLTCEPYLKTLKRMHINTGHIGEVGGYTDNAELYGRYPLKYFHKCEPLERYDTDATLGRIHAVEFLGEPQYRYGRNGKLPQEVREAFLPYASSRLATTLTLSESHNWHLYAGVADYAHYDAYRVTAPSADSWSMYDRWGETRIRWGAPLETIGEMTRSLRETSRPGSIAYWSQGAHTWGRYGSREQTSPTPDELRLQAYHALSSRITSLYWFNLSLKSIVMFRDLIEPIARVGREIRTLERFYLEGAAYQYEQVRRDGKLDWDLASIVSPDGALLFALDLDYAPDPDENVFRFGPQRPGRFEFALPPWLRQVKDVFRIDADGVYDVSHQATKNVVRIENEVNKVAIYVATGDAALRGRLEQRREALVEMERSLEFDPARSDEDFEKLSAFLAGD